MGNANLQRWYFDVDSKQCLPFTYHGMTGNQNNFVSEQQCQLTCPGTFLKLFIKNKELSKNSLSFIVN